MGPTGCTEPPFLYITAINLLAFCAVGLQSAFLHLQYNNISNLPMSPTDFSETQCLCITTLTLLSLWAKSTVPGMCIYASTLSMCRTDSTEPQFLYSTAVLPQPLWAYKII